MQVIEETREAPTAVKQGAFVFGDIAMPFWIAYDDGTGNRDVATETQLSPAPSKVEYPPPAQTRLPTLAGSTIIQRPTVDNRPRAWVWENYPGWFQRYQDLWTIIEPLHARYRLIAGDTVPWVYLKEDETKMLRTLVVSGTTVTPSYDWFRCRVVNIERRMREGGATGLVVYAETRLEFVIEDSAYNDLG